MLRSLRLGLWVSIIALAVLAGVVALGLGPNTIGPAQLPLSASIGGSFELVSHEGKPFTSAQLKGKPFTIFFGFTYCPEACPTTLLELSNLIKDLGPDADRLNYLFVSVDPERDTPEQLKLYLSAFDQRIIGLTGTLDQIADIAKKYRVYYKKVSTKEGYTMDHTASVYLMDREGQFSGMLDYQGQHAVALAKLKRLAIGS
jgi:protein SCO1